MANEARVFAEDPANCHVVQYQVAASVAVPKGTLLIANGDRVGVAHAAAARRAPLGYTTSNKATTDPDYASATNLGVQVTGVVEAVADGTILTGQIVFAGNTTANRVQAAYNGMLSIYETAQLVLGRALENAADGETVKVMLTIGTAG